MTGNPVVRDGALRKAMAAALGLIFTLVVLVLPPVANRQLADAEKTLQKPLIAVVVAVVIVAAAAWRLRFAIAVAVIVFVVAAAQVTYFIVTTQPGRSATSRAK